MKDIRLYVIGFLSCACIFLFMGQTEMESNNKFGKYQGFSNNNTLYVINTETGELFKASSTTTSERKKDENLYEYFWKQKSTQVGYKLNRKVFE